MPTAGGFGGRRPVVNPTGICCQGKHVLAPYPFPPRAHLRLVGLGLTIILLVYGSFGMRALQETTDRALAERLNLARVVAGQIDRHIANVLAMLERVAAS